MRPYGQRMGAYDYDGKDEPVAVVEKKRARQEGKRDCASHLTLQPPPVEGAARPTWERVTDELRRRAGETSGEEARVWALMEADGHARDAFGREKYGRPHQADNGRDHAVDAYQEHQDGFLYWRAEADVAHLQGDESCATEAWALYQDSLRLAHRARLYLLRRDGR